MARVKRVLDGDTFLLEDGRYIRLAGVRAPEKHQRGFEQAKEALKYLIEGKIISIRQLSTSYGRIVADVSVGGVSVNLSMRRRGYIDRGK